MKSKSNRRLINYCYYYYYDRNRYDTSDEYYFMFVLIIFIFFFLFIWSVCSGRANGTRVTAGIRGVRDEHVALTDGSLPPPSRLLQWGGTVGVGHIIIIIIIIRSKIMLLLICRAQQENYIIIIIIIYRNVLHFNTTRICRRVFALCSV